MCILGETDQPTTHGLVPPRASDRAVPPVAPKTYALWASGHWPNGAQVETRMAGMGVPSQGDISGLQLPPPALGRSLPVSVPQGFLSPCPSPCPQETPPTSMTGFAKCAHLTPSPLSLLLSVQTQEQTEGQKDAGLQELLRGPDSAATADAQARPPKLTQGPPLS